jgi:hypothetical protein
MNYEKFENLAITIQNIFTLKLRLVNIYYTFRKSQTYMKNVNYNYVISQNKETQIIPLICFLSQKMKIMKMKGGCVPYNFQNCIKFCQDILLSEYAKFLNICLLSTETTGPLTKFTTSGKIKT